MDQTLTSTINLCLIYSGCIVMILFLLFVQNLKGHRLNTTVIKYVHAVTGVQCVLLCLNEDTSCRSTNFRKTSNSDKNCELLREVHAEKPDLLLEDVQFDHYQLLDPNRVSMHEPFLYVLEKYIFIFANSQGLCSELNLASQALYFRFPPKNVTW
jgi:hypothetical protein